MEPTWLDTAIPLDAWVPVTRIAADTGERIFGVTVQPIHGPIGRCWFPSYGVQEHAASELRALRGPAGDTMLFLVTHLDNPTFGVDTTGAGRPLVVEALTQKHALDIVFERMVQRAGKRHADETLPGLRAQLCVVAR